MSTTASLGRYRILEVLGAGGTGVVFKAEHLIMRRVVAMKMIHQRLLSDRSTESRFLDEIRAIALVKGPHIVTAYDADRLEDRYYLVMEYVDGKDLRWWVKNNGPFESEWACEVCRQAAIGIQHAHRNGLVHRDIKPSNLLMASEPPLNGPTIKILDFGSAHLRSQMPTRQGFWKHGIAQARVATPIVGTPGFMAPEQVYDPDEIDSRTDIFALGCTLFYLLTGRPPFARDTSKQYWVGDASHPESGVHRPKTGGIVYFRMTDDPTDPWQKIRVAPVPELGRQCQAADVDGDGDLDVVSTSDHNMATHTISVVWWENRLQIGSGKEAGK